MPFKTYEYEHRIVAFIDILGFAEKIKQTENETNPEEAATILKDLTDSLQILKRLISKSIEDEELPLGTMASMFSDTIVVSVPKTQSYGVLYLFELLKTLQIRLIQRAIL